MHLSFSRRLSVFLCVILASSLFAQTKSADVPRVIRYSGTLTNVDGTPRTGTLGVSFAIYADDKSTAPLWQEVQNVIVDATGHYTVLLGAARSEGLPAELFATNDARWLGIRVENEQEQPRAILAAVPYALKAADAETLGGKPLSAFVLNETTTNGRTADSGETTSGTGSGSKTGLHPMSINTTSSGGTQNTVAKWTDAGGTVLGNSLLTDNGNAVGINNTSPVTALDVTGTIRSVLNSAAPFGPYMMPTAGAANSFHFGFGYNLYFDGSNWRTKGDGVHNGGSAFLSDTGTGNLSVFTLPSTGATDQVLNDATFNTNERFRITSTGNVGINNTSPVTALDVAGTIRSVLSAAAPFGPSMIPTGGAANSFHFGFGYNLYFDGSNWRTKGDGAHNGGSAFLSDTGTGNLLVFTVPSTGTADQVVSDTTFNTLEKFRITSDGKVGIGTTNPTQALDVAGNIHASGNVTAAGVLNGSAISSSGAVKFTGVPTSTSFADGALVVDASSASSTFTLFGLGVAGTQKMKVDASGNLTASGSLSGNKLVLPSTTSSSVGVIQIGSAPFLHNYGDNTFVGATAGNFTLSGNADTGVGYAALNSVTSGANNVAVGNSALANNSVGDSNVAIGSSALNGNKTGNSNIAIGAAALAVNDNTIGNVAIGDSTLIANADGGYNTGVGTNALLNNNSSYNSAFGPLALSANTSGSLNTAIGYSAGAAGVSTSNTTTSNNTFLGSFTGIVAGTTPTQSTAVGYGALVGTPNAVVLGTTTSTVGIGTSSPSSSYRLQVVGDTNITSGNLTVVGTSAAIGAITGTGAVNRYGGVFNGGTNAGGVSANGNGTGAGVIAVGGGSSGDGLSGHGGIPNGNGVYGIGSNSGYAVYADGNLFVNGGTITGAKSLDIQPTSTHVLIGDANCGTGFAAIGLGISSFSGCNNYTLLGESATGNIFINRPTTAKIFFREANIDQMTLVNSANTCSSCVGIGTTSPSDKLHVNGELRVSSCVKNSGGTAIAGTCSSDARLKKNITPFTPMLEKVARLVPVDFDWRADEFPDYHFGAERSYGLIAQEVAEVLPELVGKDEHGMNAVNYSKLPLVLLQSIRELKTENDALRQRVQELERLRADVETLKTMLTRHAGSTNGDQP